MPIQVWEVYIVNMAIKVTKTQETSLVPLPKDSTLQIA